MKKRPLNAGLPSAVALGLASVLILTSVARLFAGEAGTDASPAPSPAAASAPAGEAPLAAQASAADEAAKTRAEREEREQREHERAEILEDAREAVRSADETVKKSLPYPLDVVFGETILGITVWRYLAGAFLIMAGLLLVWLVARKFRRLEIAIERNAAVASWRMAADVALVALKNPLKLVFLALLLRAISGLLVTFYHPDVVWASNLLIFIAAALYFFDLAGYIDLVYGDRIFHGDRRLMETIRPIVLKSARLLIVAAAGMHIYQSVTGQTMFSVLAGLGIGGVALALASQETLKNLLGFAAIAFDKNFMVGDPVTIADYEGTVEHVGIRSLRLRTYDGNAVVIPNATAIGSNIINLNRRPYIRREMRIALSPLNPYEKVVEGMNAIREVVHGHDGKIAGLPPTVRFADYEPGRFVIQALFWYDADKPDYYDECSRINLEVCKRLSAAGVKYAMR